MDTEINLSSENMDDRELSLKLFRLLNEAIGSPTEVKTRRLFFAVMDDVFSQNPHQFFINSGSKAEGLNMTGSDLDMMTVHKLLEVFADKSEITHCWGYLADTEHASPGFTLLQCSYYSLYNFLEVNIFPTLCAYTEHGPVLSSEKFKSFFFRLLHPRSILNEELLKIHGPCLTGIDEYIDFAFCLQSKSWPFIAKQWLLRPRLSDWPSARIVSEISNQGLLYVPIGCKFGSSENNHHEWRMSFSVPEKMLIHSFNHTQLLCYALLKIMLKEVIEQETWTKNLLCSYFMKTVVFWMSEESGLNGWVPENMLNCFKSCFERLIYWVRLGYCPNYFIPQNNMFESKIFGERQKKLLSFLEKLRKRVVACLFRTKSIISVLNTPTEDHIRVTDQDKAIYPLLDIYLKFTNLVISPHPFYPYFLSRLQKMIGFRNSPLTRSLYLQWFVQFSFEAMSCVNYDFKSPNKKLYSKFKSLRYLCVLLTNNDLSGWVWLSSFFYCHKDYYKVLSITNYVLSECVPDKFLVAKYPSLQNTNDFYISSNRITYLQRHKLSCIYQLSLIPKPNSLFDNSDLGIANGLIAPPVVFLHFLRFMCYHRMGNVEERDKCIRDIKFTIEEDFLIGCPTLRFLGYQYLVKALLLTNRYRELHELYLNRKTSSEFWKIPYLGETKNLYKLYCVDV